MLYNVTLVWSLTELCFHFFFRHYFLKSPKYLGHDALYNSERERERERNIDLSLLRDTMERTNMQSPRLLQEKISMGVLRQQEPDHASEKQANVFSNETGIKFLT